MKAATFDGKPCKRCGGTLRYRSGHKCVACRVARNHAYYEANHEKWRAYHERMYWGSGVENFIYRAERAMSSRRSKALKCIAARQAQREELASGPLSD